MGRCDNQGICLSFPFEPSCGKLKHSYRKYVKWLHLIIYICESEGKNQVSFLLQKQYVQHVLQNAERTRIVPLNMCVAKILAMVSLYKQNSEENMTNELQEI